MFVLLHILRSATVARQMIHLSGLKKYGVDPMQRVECSTSAVFLPWNDGVCDVWLPPGVGVYLFHYFSCFELICVHSLVALGHISFIICACGKNL